MNGALAAVDDFYIRRGLGPPSGPGQEPRGWVLISSLGEGQLIVFCENALSPPRREIVMADSIGP